MTPREEKDRNLAALCHLCNIVPVWGLIFCGLVWFNSREKSRYLAGQTQQAMVFHGTLLGGIILWAVVELFTGIIGYVIPLLDAPLEVINSVLIRFLLAAYALTCAWGAWSCLTGRTFRYPLVGEATE